MVWVAAMSGRHAAARPDASTDGLMACAVLAQIVILVVVILMALGADGAGSLGWLCRTDRSCPWGWAGGALNVRHGRLRGSLDPWVRRAWYQGSKCRRDGTSGASAAGRRGTGERDSGHSPAVSYRG